MRWITATAFVLVLALPTVTKAESDPSYRAIPRETRARMLASASGGAFVGLTASVLLGLFASALTPEPRCPDSDDGEFNLCFAGLEKFAVVYLTSALSTALTVPLTSALLMHHSGKVARRRGDLAPVFGAMFGSWAVGAAITFTVPLASTTSPQAGVPLMGALGLLSIAAMVGCGYVVYVRNDRKNFVLSTLGIAPLVRYDAAGVIASARF